MRIIIKAQVENTALTRNSVIIKGDINSFDYHNDMLFISGDFTIAYEKTLSKGEVWLMENSNGITIWDVKLVTMEQLY